MCAELSRQKLCSSIQGDRYIKHRERVRVHVYGGGGGEEEREQNVQRLGCVSAHGKCVYIRNGHTIFEHTCIHL